MRMDRRCSLVVMLILAGTVITGCKSQSADRRTGPDGRVIKSDAIEAARPARRGDGGILNIFRGAEEGTRDLLGMDEPDAPPVDRLAVLRYSLTDASGTKIENPEVQRLDVDLQTGRVTITDGDGRRYPLQLSGEEADALEATLAGRRWLATYLPKEPSHPVLRMEAYIFEPGQDQANARYAVWSPGQANLPEPLEAISKLFYRAHRMVHPLSNDVNLLADGKTAAQAEKEAAAGAAAK